LPGNPDLSNKNNKFSVFLNGYFWHQHKNCKRVRAPKSNISYWIPKLQRNVKNLNKNITSLKNDNWETFVMWECGVNDENKKIIMQRKLKHGELFCGPGGMALGAKNSSIAVKKIKYTIDTIWAIDNDTEACKTFKRNVAYQNSIITKWPIEEVYKNKKLIINDDITKIDDFSKLPDIDILSFGFPCNDYSLIGKRKGIAGKYGGLYKYGVDAINAKNPKFFIAENVSGLASSSGSTFAVILDELKNAGNGYTLTVNNYKLEKYGVPQTRHRIIIVGFRNDLDKEFLTPKETHPKRFVYAKEAIEKGLVYGEGKINGAKNHNVDIIKKRLSKTVRKRLYHTKNGQNAWNADLPDDVKLNVKKATFSSIYKKLKPNKPAYTVTGSGGGGTHMYYWAKNKKDQRALTNRERARLQTFPDKFEFIGNSTDVRKQIGMAVPVLAAKIIFTAALKTYCSIPYENTEANILLNEDGTITRS
jgi:DNA (cytosine-5)-methyltransferase 1